jgi:hypothetical protein
MHCLHLGLFPASVLLAFHPKGSSEPLLPGFADWAGLLILGMASRARPEMIDFHFG